MIWQQVHPQNPLLPKLSLEIARNHTISTSKIFINLTFTSISLKILVDLFFIDNNVSTDWISFWKSLDNPFASFQFEGCTKF